MKKLFLAVLAIFSLSAVNAQFKFDISAGGAIPQGSGAKGGVLFSLEPKYSVIGGLAVGIRLEAALTARGYYSSDGSNASASANATGIVSYLATSDYYPLHYLHIGFRPFVGGGTGIYNLAAASFSGSSNSDNTVQGTGAATKFGGMARSGFEIHHFRFAVEYNFIGSTAETVTDSYGNKIGTAQTKNSYCGIKIGVLIGGGRH